jgi:hypothetical protein
MRSASCVSSHFLRRDSSGCVESGIAEGEEVVVIWVVREGPMPERRVSWRPGAEGAPRDFADRWEWLVEWPAGGAILIA